MKLNKIFVAGPDGRTVSFNGGLHALAVYPAGKGEKHSHVLLSDGRMSKISGNRIQGVGAARFCQEQGMVLAAPGDEAAQRLADHLDVQEGLAWVEEVGAEMSNRLARDLAGQQCTYVPFVADKPARPVRVAKPRAAVKLPDRDALEAP